MRQSAYTVEVSFKSDSINGYITWRSVYVCDVFRTNWCQKWASCASLTVSQSVRGDATIRGALNLFMKLHTR